MRAALLPWISITLVVISNIVYHVAQRTIPPQASAVASVLVSYVTAIVITIALWPMLKQPAPFLESLRGLNASSLLVGVSIVGVEFGFLLAYRAGWPVHSVALTAGTILALTLIPIGLFAFGESVSLHKVSGVALCLVGLYLIQRP